ncbi:hypothetical protein BT63DRAFT_239210 [Microthyrium microscopicum]|uniref:Ams2/SPT21 N-terminal domain-containing protein n=1 Tax=Microthyrium microscopicum TaxID=703497 RepID=A0A6A6UFA1_9PEZI|nr:hypothetical protein BT63DRAFT_239210 [Microthyrium microscopicum]
MSSPAFFNEARSPINAGPPQDLGDQSSEIERRPMRVKVLYTFDDQNKTNCLARLPTTLSVRVVTTEEQTQIGVIELKTCIKAIVLASPELLSKLENDYTVYAYDYSEYETPLVGQGMLSRVLASTSPTPSAPASQSGTWITGRVCKNILGLFANGAKETLEVKLKLVAVPNQCQNEYDRTMESYRSQTRGMAESFNFDMASNFSAHEAELVGNTSFPPQQAVGTGNRTSAHGVDALQDMLTPNFNNDYDDYRSQTNSIYDGSRPGTPGVAPGMVGDAGNGLDMSRPSSRASKRPSAGPDEQSMEDGQSRKRARVTQAEWQGRTNFGAQPNSLRVQASIGGSIREFRPSLAGNHTLNEIGPRAPTPRPAGKRLQPTNLSQNQSGFRRGSSLSEPWTQGPPSDTSVYDDAISNIGSSPDIPSSPPVFDQQDDYQQQPPSSPMLPENHSLHDSGFQSDFPTDAIQSDAPLHGELVDSNKSKVDRWRETRIRRNNKRAWSEYAPAGSEQNEPPPPPPAPTPPTMVVETLRQSRALNAIGVSHTMATSSSSRRSSKPKSAAVPSSDVGLPLESNPYPSNTPPVQTHPGIQPSTNRQPSTAQPYQNHPAYQLSSEAHVVQAPLTLFEELSRVASSGPTTKSQELQPAASLTSGPGTRNIPLPKRNPTSRQGKRPPVRSSLPRSNTWAGPSSDMDVIEVVDVEEIVPGVEDPNKKQKLGSGAIRSTSISKQLHAAVATGEPATYCMNCGAIETPTWRPYWVRVEYGTGKDVVCDDETGIHCVHPLHKDADGKTTTYRIYKKTTSLKPEEKEMFDKFVLCNPCGDYLRKHKIHRPQAVFEKYQKLPKKPAGAGSGRNRKRTRNPVVPSSDATQDPASTATDQMPHSDVYPDLPTQPTYQTPSAPKPVKDVMGPPEIPEHTAVLPDNERETAMALTKALQQSPARAVIARNKESPVEIVEGLTPKPLNRVLFPSPGKSNGRKFLDDPFTTSPISGSAGNISKKTSTECAPPTDEQIRTPLEEPEQADKENQPPPMETDDNLAACFYDVVDTTDMSSPARAEFLQFFKTPTTSNSNRRSTSRGALTELPELGSDAPNLPTTPSRIPRASPNPLTPWTKQIMEGFPTSPNNSNTNALDLNSHFNNFELNQNVGNVFDSPNTQLNKMLSSDIWGAQSDMPSSPPIIAGGIGDGQSYFNFYEDATATVGAYASADGAALALEMESAGADQPVMNQEAIDQVDTEGAEERTQPEDAD